MCLCESAWATSAVTARPTTRVDRHRRRGKARRLCIDEISEQQDLIALRASGFEPRLCPQSLSQPHFGDKVSGPKVFSSHRLKGIVSEGLKITQSARSEKFIISPALAVDPNELTWIDNFLLAHRGARKWR